jgi:hypothetical protein
MTLSYIGITESEFGMSYGYDWKKIHPKTLMRPSEMLRFFFAVMEDPNLQSVTIARDLLVGEVKFEFMEFVHQYQMHTFRTMEQGLEKGEFETVKDNEFTTPTNDDVDDYLNDPDKHMREKIEAMLKRKFDENKGEQHND